MSSTACSLLAAAVSLATLATVPPALAQEIQHERPKFVVVDLGTFGGPQSHFFSEPVVNSANDRGTVVGGADLLIPDPFPASCVFDCHVMHAFQWRDGELHDLGALAPGVSSTALWINENGLTMGFSENGVIDPIFGGPQMFAVIWKEGQIINLGSLGGGFSGGNAMNNRGEVVGASVNTVPDPFSFLSLGTQMRAFLWRDGVLLDLDTLGGPDAWAASINDRGQIAGWSLVDSAVNSSTGQPTQHPFLWENGKMIDLHTLGGTFAFVGSLQSPGAGSSLNNRGQVIGTSNLLGDSTHHPFLWDRGILTDLGTLGGDNGEAWWINDRGEIVGRADLPGSQVHHAFLWENGKMIDLGAAPGQPCSTAIDINSRGQVIINTGICPSGGGPGLLWEDGKLYDLNTLIPANSGLAIGHVNFINDRGEIAATGLLPNGDERAILLVPCDKDHPGLEGCDFDPAAATAASQIRAQQIFHPSSTKAGTAELTLAETMRRFYAMTIRRSRRYGNSPQ